MVGTPVKRHSPFRATKLWNQLLKSFKEGMELKRRRWRLKSYEQCFTGAEALDWLHNYLQNSSSFGAHVTREQAFMLLQKFLDNDVFRNAAGKASKKFQDTNCLYRFNEKKENLKEINSKGKENVTPQNSLNHIIKIFGRRHSRPPKIHQQTPFGNIIENSIPSVTKNQDVKKNRSASMNPLGYHLNNKNEIHSRRHSVTLGKRKSTGSENNDSSSPSKLRKTDLGRSLIFRSTNSWYV
ncbi:DEP domain-containing protein 1A-like [Hydractinia symbiolongicarpus]|uniref:DEP domain-containing protein 1A-like n=1 Tax=Hydractinia symbiolongicarpus TaxID=13093 RepID=UPI00254C2A25|nr:DEP domain-containing protein 1A-like [Hydractinia symbiolongicarpus]XP_057299674.1 DEP domain-containing protein 1A-like [Hydractinia symbiolongicarpus]